MPRGLQSTAVAAVLSLLVALASLGAVLYQDDLTVVFASWAGGSPRLWLGSRYGYRR